MRFYALEDRGKGQEREGKGRNPGRKPVRIFVKWTGRGLPFWYKHKPDLRVGRSLVHPIGRNKY